MDETIFKSILKVLAVTLSSSLLAALLTTYGNYLINRKKLHAEIISKSRIEWIQEVRRVTSELINAYYKAFELTKKLTMYNWLYTVTNDLVAKSVENDDSEEYERSYKKSQEILNDKNNTYRKFIEQMNKIKEKEVELKLFLPNKSDGSLIDEHKEIKESLESLYTMFKDAIKLNDIDDLQPLEIILNRVMEDISDYLKNEWDRAKAKK